MNNAGREEPVVDPNTAQQMQQPSAGTARVDAHRGEQRGAARRSGVNKGEGAWTIGMKGRVKDIQI